MIFYTADLHFGYEQILSSAQRPFRSIREMDEALIENWNSTVSPGDTVYFVGDIGFYGGPIPGDCLSGLSGRKHLIRGNHDTGLDDQHRLFDYFESVTDFLEIDDGDAHITLCHYPIVYMQKGYMIHGHLHETRRDVLEIMKKLPRVMNAGVDINNFKPVTLFELIENNRVFYHDPAGERGASRFPEGAKSRAGKWKADFRPLPVRRNI